MRAFEVRRDFGMLLPPLVPGLDALLEDLKRRDNHRLGSGVVGGLWWLAGSLAHPGDPEVLLLGKNSAKRLGKAAGGGKTSWRKPSRLAAARF